MLFADEHDPTTVLGVIAGIVMAILGPGGVVFYYLKTADKRRFDDAAARRKEDSEVLKRWKNIADKFESRLDDVEKELRETKAENVELKIHLSEARKKAGQTNV